MTLYGGSKEDRRQYESREVKTTSGEELTQYLCDVPGCAVMHFTKPEPHPALPHTHSYVVPVVTQNYHYDPVLQKWYLGGDERTEVKTIRCSGCTSEITR